MNIHITEAPAGAIPHIELAGRCDLDDGSVLIHLSPTDTTPGGIALTLVQAMGKDLRITGGNTVRTDEHRRYAPLWAQAHGITDLVVLDVQQLKPRTLQTLFGLLPPEVTVTLVCEPGHQEETHWRLKTAGIDAEPLDWDTWTDGLPSRASASTVNGEQHDGYALDHLPLVDFLVFRYYCRELNTPQRFAAIDADYVRVYHAATSVAANETAVIDHLDRATSQAATTAPIMVAIRATQCAFFDRGVWLQVHVDRLLGVLSCNRSPHATDDDWRALRAYIRPERSATAALYLLGTAADALTTTSLRDVEQALTSGVVSNRPIPALARPLLAAQLARRQHEGAGPGDSYLGLSGERRHLEILIDARRDLGLPIDGRNLRDDHTNNTTRVLNRLGLAVRSIQ